MSLELFRVTAMSFALSLAVGGCDDDPPPPFSVSFTTSRIVDPAQRSSICCESSSGGVGWSLTGDLAGPLLFVNQETDDSPMTVTG